MTGSGEMTTRDVATEVRQIIDEYLKEKIKEDQAINKIGNAVNDETYLKVFDREAHDGKTVTFSRILGKRRLKYFDELWDKGKKDK